MDPSKQTLDVETRSVVTTPSAKQVKAIHRFYQLEQREGSSAHSSPPQLRYAIGMAAMGKEMSPHLDAVLMKLQDSTTGGEINSTELLETASQYKIVDVR